jgi:hypothetical protein
MEPATPPALSSQEALLLALVQSGARDAEIAVRLSITIADAKSRIAALVLRAGVPARADLIGWEPRDVPPAALSVSTPPPARRLPPIPYGTVASAVGFLAACAVAAFLFAPALFDGSAAPAVAPALRDPSAGPIPPQSAAPIALPAPVPPFPAFRAGPVTDTSEDYAIFFTTGVLGHSYDSLERVYADSSGEVHRDTLLAPPPGAQLLSVVAGGDGELAATLCRGECFPRDPAHPNARTSILRSRDGGVTWGAVADVEGVQFAYALAKGQVLLWGNAATAATAVPGVEVRPLPFTPPFAVSAQGESVEFWAGGVRLADQPGHNYSVPASGPNPLMLEAVTSPDETLAMWSERGPDQPGTFVALFNAQSEALVSAFSSSGVWPSILVRKGVSIGTASFPLGTQRSDLPGSGASATAALIDLRNGVVRPLARPAVALPSDGGRNSIVAVARGPFARVTGEACLPLRDRPQLDAREVACAAPGVLLRAGDLRVHQDATWLSVTAPGGTFGWAEVNSLER